MAKYFYTYFGLRSHPFKVQNLAEIQVSLKALEFISIIQSKLEFNDYSRNPLFLSNFKADWRNSKLSLSASDVFFTLRVKVNCCS